MTGRGQSTLELLIALAIMVISISAGIVVFFGGQSLLVDTQLSDQASYLARQLLENARSQARQNFSGVATTASGTQGRFTTQTIVLNVDSSTKRVTGRVTWSVDTRSEQTDVVTYLTDWRNTVPPPDPGDTGGGGTSGDWKNPTTLGSIDLGPGNSATGLDVVNKYVYMTASASAKSKPDFFIVDATNGSSPSILSSIDTGPSLNAIDVSGSYAYVANNSTTDQLQVIDVSNRSSPFLAKSFTLSGVSGNGAVGNAIFYGYSKIFIGTKNATGPEFHVIDVSSPTNPSELGSFEVGADVNKIYVYGDIAYLATSADNAELKLLDISSPSAISLIGNFNATSTEDGKSVYVVGKKLYMGRLAGGSHEFQILDVSSSTSVQALGIQSIGDDVNAVAVRDNLAFVGTSDSNKEFQVWNISNPASTTLWSSFNFPQVASGIDYENNLVYVAVRSNDALRIITSQ